MGCVSSSSSVSSPATVTDVETKIIILARGITNTVKASTATDLKSDPNSRGKGIEKTIEESFKGIIMLGKQAKNLDGKVLNEVLIACNVLRINYTGLAAKLAFLSNTAKILIEERTVRTDENYNDLGSNSSNNKSMNHVVSGQEGHIPKGNDAEAIQVNQMKPVKASKDSKLFELVERKSSSYINPDLCGSDGLPPLKDFSKNKKDFSSHHSNDFGFFDLSMHDNSVHEQQIRNELSMPRKVPTMKVQYSAAQLTTDGI